jgi:hypothetical protein
VTEETANLYATNKGKMVRYVDGVKKLRGATNELPTGLKLDVAPPPAIAGLRIK